VPRPPHRHNPKKWQQKMRMRPFKLNKAFTLMEPGPVVLVTTHDGKKDNIMTIWIMNR
jgi:flavin reductase (DIM6/NTAB) family NADH-FMN oxidoreductase RutF